MFKRFFRHYSHKSSRSGAAIIRRQQKRGHLDLSAMLINQDDPFICLEGGQGAGGGLAAGLQPSPAAQFIEIHDARGVRGVAEDNVAKSDIACCSSARGCAPRYGAAGEAEPSHTLIATGTKNGGRSP